MLMTALSIAVAAIPEALPAVVTMSLAIGARRLVKRNALVRRLSAVETLGSVTYICTDKTGTLTENRMRVKRVSEESDELLTALALCNDVHQQVGDPMELALVEFAETRGHARAELERSLPRIDELPFTPERARVTTVHRGNFIVAYTKGAPEQVIAACNDRLRGAALTETDREALLTEARAMASDGLRVLAVSTRRFDATPDDPTEYERAHTYLGLVALADPPRAKAPEAVATARRAGIHVVMITGDHAATALAIAKRVGIADDRSQVLTGAELRNLSPEELEQRIETVRVYARVAPEDKIFIVRALQARGELVAMTGDGVNDAPALKRAEIGIAMGRDGTDIAREASSLVLLDDDFATIVAAVREGRRIYDNIRRFVRYTLAGNAGELWPLMLAPLFGLPLLLLPIQILWINLVTDGLPGLALTSERAERDVMDRAPRPPRETIFARGLWQHTVWVGALMGGLTLATASWFLHHGSDAWQTMAFTLLTFAQMGHVLAIRSEHTSLAALGVFSNRPLVGAVALTVALQLLIIYVAPLQRVFGTTSLSIGEFATVVVLSAVIPFAVEIEKSITRARR
jgi:Ca2+-transporting ATPase